MIHLFLETKFDPFITSFYKFFRGEVTQADVESLHAALQDYEDALKADKFFLSDQLGTDSVTFLDIMLFPHLERLSAYKDIWNVGDIDKFVNLWRWYDRMISFEWIQRFKVPVSRFLNLQTRFNNGDRGLKLPVEYYDEEVC